MKVVTKREENGSLVYSSDIVSEIVECALGEIDGVVKYPPESKEAKSAIKVDQIGDEMYIDVYVKLKYNVDVSDVASTLQSTVKSTIENMTEFRVHSVNVHVKDVEFEEV